ncbi:MAG: hypothetical protein RIQ84_118 [Pseudomonadota bacterium]|jgi:ABC-type cobalamin/Fe3+-siderophores transport system ATPase subunit
MSSSSWSKWDLHIHTPLSIVNQYAGEDVWEKFICALEELPNEFKVIGINDYIFLDGYKKVVEEKKKGRLANIDLILPVIELRLDKFGGSNSHLSRVNYHIIFSNQIDAEVIESQFLAALCSKYRLTPQYDGFKSSGLWSAVPTRKSVEELGQMIINSVPDEEKKNYKSPLVEGFNNLCLSLNDVQEILGSPTFLDRVVTAVGKTEWADVKWNDQAIADKKNIINSADLVFMSAESDIKCKDARDVLTASKVNNNLLDCSDAHYFPDSKEKDRIGKCFTWIKSEPTFEGLRQAIFEYGSRVSISLLPPLEPIYQIKKVQLNFPLDTKLERENIAEYFCYRGVHEFSFSPYLTCLVGGRGVGKSTLLHLMSEKLNPGNSEFFKGKRLTPANANIRECVEVSGISEAGVVEFLQQNEIEQFAADHRRLTAAILARLKKLDNSNEFEEIQLALSSSRESIKTHKEILKTENDFKEQLEISQSELVTQKGVVDSFQSVEYKKINDNLNVLNAKLQNLLASKKQLQDLFESINDFVDEYWLEEDELKEQDNPYAKQIQLIVEGVKKLTVQAQDDPALKASDVSISKIQTDIDIARDGLSEYLKSRGLSSENLGDVSRAAGRIAVLEREIPALSKKIDGLKGKLEKFSNNRSVVSRYTSLISNLLTPINISLSSQSEDVKAIELRYEFDEDSFNESVIELIAKSISSKDGRSQRTDFVKDKLSRVNFLALGDQQKFLLSISEEDQSVVAKSLRDYYGEKINYDLLKLDVETLVRDVDHFWNIRILYDGKSIQDSSFGQRCTAVIVVLILLGNTPIVIDEPEAHLDSSLIAKYLVDLIKVRKNHRQIIFATHNANLVVNGDSELVHCLFMNGENVSNSIETTIENLKNREHLLALEGGLKAFLRRERRYSGQ